MKPSGTIQSCGRSSCAPRQRNVEVWRLLGRLFAALTAQPKKLRASRWLAVHHGS